MSNFLHRVNSAVFKKIFNCTSSSGSVIRRTFYKVGNQWFDRAGTGLPWVGSALLSLWLCCCLSYVQAANDDEYYLDLPAQPLLESLNVLSEQTKTLILFPYDLVENRQANAVKGSYTVYEAFSALLRDADLTGRFSKRGVLVISKKSARANTKQKVGEMNMHKKRSLLTGIAAFFGATAAVLSPAPVLAQEEKQNVSVVEEIIVTAQKREQRLDEVPISIAALRGEELADRRIGDLTELAMAVPGLTVQSNGGNTTRTVIRGIGASGGSSAALVGLYLDDISVSGNPALVLDVRPYDLERVEVLRGPQGTLFGDGSVGGTIRYISKRPELDRFGARADLEVAGTRDGALSFQTQGVVNIPLMEDRLGMRVVGTFDHAGGWVDRPTAGTRPDHKNINDSDVTNVRTNVLWLPTAALEVSGQVIVHRNDGNITGGEDGSGNYEEPFTDFTSDQSVEDDYEIYGLTLNYDFGFAELVSASSYINARREVLVSQLLQLFVPPAVPSGAVLFNDIEREIFNQEVRLSSNGEGRVHWLIGGNYRDRELVQNFDSFFGASSGPAPAPFTGLLDETTESFAFFGEASVDLFDWLEIGGGMRYFEDDRTQFDGIDRLEASFDATTGRVFVRAAATDTINLYASYAQGFRSGGFNPVGVGRLETFGPEDVDTYEVGAKGTFLNGRISGELAFFYSAFDDSQVLGTDNATFLILTTNGGDVDVFGFEGQLNLQLTENLRLDIGGSYIDSEFVSLNLPAGISGPPVMVGDRLPFAPSYNFTVSPVYDFEWRGHPGFLRLDYSQQGVAFNYFRNFPSDLVTGSDVINMLNVNVQLDVSDSVSLGLFASNLLNDRGLADANGEVLGTRSRPRTIGARLSLQY